MVDCNVWLFISLIVFPGAYREADTCTFTVNCFLPSRQMKSTGHAINHADWNFKSVVACISAREVEEPGSIPGVKLYLFSLSRWLIVQ